MSNRRLKARPGRRTEVTFPADPTDAEAYHQARNKLAEATRRRDSIATLAERGGDDPGIVAELAAADTAVAAAQAALDDLLAGVELIRFQLRSCGAKRAEKLMREHPPTEAQVEQHKADAARLGERPTALMFDPEAFPPVLIAECCTLVDQGDGDPIENVTADELTDWFDDAGWSIDDIGELFGTCRVLTQLGTTINRADLERLGKG